MRAAAAAVALAAALALAILAVPGCGRHREATAPPLNPPPPTPQTQMTGVFVGGAENGLLDLTIDVGALASAFLARDGGASPETTVTALGVMSPDGGGVVNLTGAYDTATDSLHLSGQGYALAGEFLPNGVPFRLQGRFTSPSGRGQFVALIGARNSVVHAFCATYEDSAATMWGTLNVAVTGTALAGFEVVDGDTAVVALFGTANGSGTTRALAFTGSGFVGNGSWNVLTGHIAGVWASPRGTGVWSGDPCLPGTASSQSRSPASSPPSPPAGGTTSHWSG